MRPVEPVNLQNDFVRLEPLHRDHASEYLRIGQEPGIWTYLSPEPFRELCDAERWIEEMMARANYAATFSVFDILSGRLAGSSSYLNANEAHGSVEIGFTWYGSDYQRTHVNTATKLALLAHAFDELEAIRVQFQTDKRNTRSQKAIERIGGTLEGVLRKHKVYADGFVRDSVVYSITDDEWPLVTARLQSLLR